MENDNSSRQSQRLNANSQGKLVLSGPKIFKHKYQRLKDGENQALLFILSDTPVLRNTTAASIGNV